MLSNTLLQKVKQLREITGVGFKDCKYAIDENNGDIEKSIEFLRKKGIAKAIKKMGRIATDGLVCIYEKDNKFSMIEINSETDFVAKNNEFINFAEEVSKLALTKSGEISPIDAICADRILSSAISDSFFDTRRSKISDNSIPIDSTSSQQVLSSESFVRMKSKSLTSSEFHDSPKY